MNLIFIYLKAFVEILFLGLVFYSILNFMRRSQAIQMLKVIIVILGIFFITQRLDLEVLSWILNKIFAISVILLIVIFQPELRNGLIRLGRSRFLGIFFREEERWEELIKGILRLSDKKIGCLVAIEGEVSLQPYIEEGVKVDGVISPELMESIFYPNNPLHDGGAIIRDKRIVSAACFFPVSNNPYLSKTLGMRHRAAVGLSEDTDALVIVVSEENGTISLASKGILRLDVDEKILRDSLKEISQRRYTRKLK